MRIFRQGIFRNREVYMKDNEYTRKEKICPLIGDYCNEEHKDCDR